MNGIKIRPATIARAACDWSCEMSIYLDKDARGRGFGRMLYEDLEHRLKDMGMVKSSAYRYLLELEKRGIISYKGKRTLESPLQRKMKCSFRSIPLLGRITCGTPDEQEEYVKE
jgi:GNAT superfamily N-acetyltransferase